MALKFTINKEFVNMHLGGPDPAIAMYILNIVIRANSGSDLVLGMKELKEKFPGMDHFFAYGFGGGHMWVKQRCLQKETENWITVYF